eukprot:CAMPEP_0204369742 /NCGR_PEP_ID=MMETSP0469-20131031/45204_1 /ASSEMBLY_ACC=CAM_ASM_000384 /TAXON_ID=2969 /ORGANISM="Oxyrrhis marina" /LENGTH=72 /DNA_ID=CAMNT_0051359543 /DNA_START=126 /DNA_END=340 /DNA_ORIENTATION=+
MSRFSALEPWRSSVLLLVLAAESVSAPAAEAMSLRFSAVFLSPARLAASASFAFAESVELTPPGPVAPPAPA